MTYKAFYRVNDRYIEVIRVNWFSMPNGTKIELKLLENWKVNK